MADATPEPFNCPDLRALNLPACPVAVWSVTFDLFHILDSTRALVDQNLCSNQKTNKIQYFKYLAPNRIMTENNHSGVWLLLASLTLQVCHLLASVGPELSSQTAVTQSSFKFSKANPQVRWCFKRQAAVTLTGQWEAAACVIYSMKWSHF